MGLARVNIPSVFVPGGTMNAGPEMLTLEQLGMYSAKFERGELMKRSSTGQNAMHAQAVRMFLYRNCIYHADYGRGTWTCTSRHSPDACNQLTFLTLQEKREDRQ